MSSNILGSNALHTQYDSTNITATGVSDPIVSIAEKGVEAFADAQGFYLVNELPHDAPLETVSYARVSTCIFAQSSESTSRSWMKTSVHVTNVNEGARTTNSHI